MPNPSNSPIQERDERYGYPVRLVKSKRVSYNAYFVGEFRFPAVEKTSYLFVSSDTVLLNRYNKKNKTHAYEAQLLTDTLDNVVFLDPPEGKLPSQVGFIEGIFSVNGLPLELVLRQALEKHQPYKIWFEDSSGHEGRKIDVYCQYYRYATLLDQIMITNELKRLGIWRICEVHYSTVRNAYLLRQ